MSVGSEPVSIQQAFENGVKLHQSGRLAEAEAIYRQILNQQPEFADAIHMLGVLAHQVGRGEMAVELIGRAISLQPQIPAYYLNRGVTFAGMGRMNEAMESYRQAIAINPQYAEAHFNLGMAYYNTGRSAEALESFDRALAIHPEFPDAHHYRGDALGRLRRWPEAEEAYRTSLEIRPEHADTLVHLAEAMQAQNQYGEAVELFHQALAIEPAESNVHNNLGHCLYNLGRLDEAILAYRQAIALKGDSYLALSNLGNSLFHQGKADEAVAAYEQCIAVRPDFPEAHNNLGNALWAMGRMDDSIAAYRKAQELRPNYLNAMSNLAGNLKDTGRLEEALPYYQKIRELDPNDSGLHSNFIYVLNHYSDAGPGKILAEQDAWDRQHARPLADQIRPHGNDRSPERRLKIGYVSADFREHVVAWNLLPILEQHDHQNFEIFCYSNVINSNATTERIKAQADQWRAITGLDDERTAEMIRKDQIDILIDLSMHSSGNRLTIFARKPAPIQMTYLGYCGATGLSTMDYRFSDPYLDSKETEKNYREKTVYLPHSYWCYRPGGDAPEPSVPPLLEKGHVAFGCLNNFAKMSLPAQKLWGQILSRVKDSHLLVHSQPGIHREEFKSRFAGWGIEAHRLEFVAKQLWEPYMRTFGRIDIALDPFPYEGGISTCDALWMGVPVVTLVGETSLGRAGKSILSNVGLPELIATKPEEYVDIAVKLAGDVERLKDLRSSLRKRMSESSLMNAEKFTSDLETIFRQVWRNWCAGE